MHPDNQSLQGKGCRTSDCLIKSIQNSPNVLLGGLRVMSAKNRKGGTSSLEDESSAEKSSRLFNEFPNEIKTPITEVRPNLWDRVTLGHYTGLVWKAFRQTVTPKDLLPLHIEYSAEECWRRFQKQWRGPEKSMASYRGDSSTRKAEPSSSISSGKSGKPPKSRGVSCSLMRAFCGFIVTSSILEICFDILRLAPVYILSRMINFISSDESDSVGYMLCGAMFAVSILMLLSLNGLVFVSCCGGVQIRSALLAAIYRKCLVVSNESSQQFTSGDLMNMISVDIDNVYQFTMYSTLVWGATVRILSSVAIIWYYLGPSSLAGVSVIVACIPITVALSSAIARYQDQQMAEKDKRLDVLNEILSGMKMIKLYAWEIPFISKVRMIRARETGYLRKYLLGQALLSLVWYCSPFLVTATAFGAYVLCGKNHVLTPDKAFVSLFLFNNMRFSLTFLPITITMMLKALVSLERVHKYLLCEEIHSEDITHYVQEGEDIRLSNASFSWGGPDPTISNLNLTVNKGELIAIVGKVGSGKSSLLNAILGGMKKLKGTIDIRKESVAYVPQQAWIQNETIRQNIIFTALTDDSWYREVVEKCCMLPDLKLFPAGDRTEIGEKGVNLSGGQKQRISMARAVYQRAKIYLLDDPLSAVDAHVSSELFNNVIGPKGLLKNCTRVLVTHSVAVLPFVDRIVILENGKIAHMGTYQDILKMDIKLRRFFAEKRQHTGKNETGITGTRLRPEASYSSSRKISASSVQVDESLSSSPLHGGLKGGMEKSKGALIGEEAMEVGDVKWSIYGNVMRNFGFLMAFLCIVGFTIYRTADVYSTIWLSEWSNDGVELLKQHNMTEEDLQSGKSNQTEQVLDEIVTRTWERMWVYLGIGGGQVIGAVIGTSCLAIGCLSASSTLHSHMLYSIMRAPMSFFDTTPLGRIINRFGKDIDVLDLELYIHLDGWLDAAFQVVATVILICIEIPFFVVFVVPICSIYSLTQKVYVVAARQFQRLQSTTRSPVLNNFSETLNGVSSIRAYRVEQHFIKKCQIRVDLNQNCYFHSMAIGRWAAIRIDWLSAIVGCLTCGLIVYYRAVLNAGVAGLILSYALSVCDAVSWMIRIATDVESAVVAAERIDEYSNIESEAPWTREGGPVLDGNWPHKGEVTFVRYSTRYREGMDLVLKDINLKIRCGEKVGVVGRTGAGKSSLTLALFRIIEPASGRIIIDEVDTSKLGLHDLRSRITMIPQDPILFRGTIRFNLDPQGLYTDQQLYAALERAHLKKTGLQLNYAVTQGGTNLALGMRQLVCLARALLRKSKIILLDEATAAVDMETDAYIQETIRRDFASSTIITIAHRLNTVFDYDTIVVLSEGRVVEKGSPRLLLADRNSHFHSMAEDAGLVY
ncbi:multidrug resistance-associated protein 1-like isoform X2 [Varroa destructor]|uniref:Multidrug resistance-associated protein 1 n=1 Tax=Varroa destructor TaxID=109461 RepID=A0A7M7MCR6_VARDE|nr:multidrug resistance-associated protein 1-like isoform X2 [Varroa destructor]